MGGSAPVIDLHTHTTASDGMDAPAALLERAAEAGLEAIAITDHDTCDGWREARAAARDGLELIAGVELSVQGAHLLGYFFDAPPPADFLAWLDSLRANRRRRNLAIAEKLREHGMDVACEEAEALGRNITGRAHFARVLLRKRYVRTWSEAFDRYLDEGACCYVERADPLAEEGIARLRAAGAFTSLAHPVRLRQTEPLRFIDEMVRDGLQAIEAFHSDHSAADTAAYLSLAARYNIGVSGGSDYHGPIKPEARLGSGRDGNARCGRNLLDDLRRRAACGE
jgi:predicted metal-dependent phosphoesterase TrpH